MAEHAAGSMVPATIVVIILGALMSLTIIGLCSIPCPISASAASPAESPAEPALIAKSVVGTVNMPRGNINSFVYLNYVSGVFIVFTLQLSSFQISCHWWPFSYKTVPKHYGENLAGLFLSGRYQKIAQEKLSSPYNTHRLWQSQ